MHKQFTDVRVYLSRMYLLAGKMTVGHLWRLDDRIFRSTAHLRPACIHAELKVNGYYR